MGRLLQLGTLHFVLVTPPDFSRKLQRGTSENSLATPARPIEVMVRNIAPFIIFGYSMTLI